MGLNFRRSIRICKGLRINFGKTGTSISFGSRGLHHTIHSSGKRTTSAVIKGTGLHYTSTSSSGKGKSYRERNSFSTMNKTKQQAYAEKTKRLDYVRNYEMVNDYNDFINQIQTIHTKCSEPIDWISLKNKPEPFNRLYPGPLEEEAQKVLENVKPSLIGRFLPSFEKNRMQKFFDDVKEAKDKDYQVYSDWENLKKLANQVLSGDIESYFYVVTEMSPFDDILDFGSDFNIGTDCPDFIEVEFYAKTNKVVPNHVVSITKTGKLSSKKMTKTMYHDIAQDYICSCTLRVAREIFALLPVNNIIIHVIDMVSCDLGDECYDTVLSVHFQREQFEKIDFELIDASDTIEYFYCNMDFKKTQGLKPVSRIVFKNHIGG